MRALLRRWRWVYLVPVLALVTLTSWAVASPIGSSPDDDFHLTSAWCASVSADANCGPGTDSTNRTVPEALLQANCYYRDADASAACQEAIDFDPTSTQSTARGNFVGAYPPVFFAVMGTLVGPDILTSAILMRVLSAVLFVALITATVILLPAARRMGFVLAWIATTIPLGAFLIASNNPSSWSITGVGTAWIALYAFFETEGRRRVGLAIVFVIAAVMAAGSRGDSAVYIAMGIAVVLAMRFRLTKRFALLALPALGIIVVCAVVVLSAQMVVSGFNGFGGTGSTATGDAPNYTAILAFNILNVPSLWAGVFGSWGLGWLEVGLPPAVSIGSLGIFVVVATVGFARLTTRKAIALAAIGLALIALPVIVLTRGADVVGTEVQPRYLLPLIVMFAGILLLQAGDRPIEFSRGHVVLIASTLTLAHFISLHVTLRRYVTGNDDQGLNLDAGVEWWWASAVSPMGVLLIGAVSYGAMLAILSITYLRSRTPVATVAA